MTAQARMTAADFLAQTRAPKASKYGNKRTVLDGITFDSQGEADHYAMLKLREKAGEISQLERQKPFPIVAGGAGTLCAVYKADFAYFDHVLGRGCVVDFKGVETDVFKLKKKLVEAIYGVEVECVRAGE